MLVRTDAFNPDLFYVVALVIRAQQGNHFSRAVIDHYFSNPGCPGTAILKDGIAGFQAVVVEQHVNPVDNLIYFSFGNIFAQVNHSYELRVVVKTRIDVRDIGMIADHLLALWYDGTRNGRPTARNGIANHPRGVVE